MQITIYGPGISTETVSCGTALPITLISFTGNCTSKGVVLEWSTATEVNNKFFTIERSADGNNWSIIKMIPGAGNSTTEINYSTTDSAPLTTTAYYRLIQTDIDGNAQTFNVIAVDPCDGNNAVSVYPNPGNGIYTLESGIYKAGQLLTFYNIMGQQVYTAQLTARQATIDISNQPQGIYLYRITSASGDQVAQGKVVKNQ
jgi:hypothetical protein